MQLIRKKVNHLEKLASELGAQKTKLAAKTLLSENPATWGSELLAVLYRAHPWIGTLQVNLQVEATDESRGYQYGLFQVSPSQDQPVPLGTPTGGNEMDSPAQPQQEPAPETLVRIPVIVEANKVYPFDIAIMPDGTFTVCSETRVNAALFDSSTFAPVDTKAAAQGATTGEDGAGGFGAEVPGDSYSGRSGPDGAMGTMGKRASIDFNKLNIQEPQVVAFLEKIASDETLKAMVSINPHFGAAIKAIASSVNTNKEKQAASLPSNPAAVTVHKVPGGYNVQSCMGTRHFHSNLVPNHEAESISPKVKQAAINGETVLLTKSTEPLRRLKAHRDAKVLTKTGAAHLTNQHGSTTQGVVLTDVKTLDGGMTDNVIVVGKHGSSYQEQVAGAPIEATIDLTKVGSSEFKGEGFMLLGEQAYEPFTVKNTVTYQDGRNLYLAEHPLLGNITLEKTASVKTVVPSANSWYLIPEDARFSQFTKGVSYLQDPSQMNKIASRHDHVHGAVLIHEAEDLFKLAGATVGELASLPLTENHALLALGLLGDSPEGAKEKIAAVKREGAVRFVAARNLKVAKEKQAAAKSPFADVIAKGINQDFTKVAALITQNNTVDTVLSLGFVTPENIDGYIDSIPEIEEALSRSCELLLGVRLGLQEVPERALTAAVTGLDKAITGLKKLQIRQGTEAAIR